MPLDKGEVVRSVDPVTGAEKETNAIRMDLIPPPFLWELGRVYGLGAAKYDDHNWRRGYKWSNSIAALKRHLERWIDGEEFDELGTHHLAHVGWHAATLYTFIQEHPELDDRFKRPDRQPEVAASSDSGSPQPATRDLPYSVRSVGAWLARRPSPEYLPPRP